MHLYKIPDEDIYPNSVPEEINIFCIGLRNIDETIDGKKPMKFSVAFDISGDKDVDENGKKKEYEHCNLSLTQK